MRFRFVTALAAGCAVSFAACDSGGSSQPAPPPQPALTVDGGPDRDVAARALVQLAATSTNAVGTTTYSWTQVSGATVTFVDTTAEHPSFPAPDIPSGATETLEFAVAGTDEDGRVAEDRVILNVASAERLVFLSDSRNVGVKELEIHDTGSNTTVVISGPTTRSRDVIDFAWRPDEGAIAFTTQDGSLRNLFVVRPGGTGLIQVNAELSGAVIHQFSWLPDSSRLFYRADFETVGVAELFMCDADGSNSTKVSGAMVSGGDVTSMSIAANGAAVIFQSDRETDNLEELYRVQPDGTALTKLSPVMVASGDVKTFNLSPDGTHVAFFADAETDGQNELYCMAVDGVAPVKLSGAMVVGGSVASFEWSPDNSAVAYIADQDVDTVQELYVTTRDGMTRNKVNTPLVSGGDVGGFLWSPDGSTIAYDADQDTDGVTELFTAGPTGVHQTKANGVLVAGGEVQQYFWSPNSATLAYVADQDMVGVLELYTTQVSGGANAKASGSMVVGGDVQHATVQWSPDSSRVMFRADRLVNGRNELFTVAASGDGLVKCNGVLSGAITSESWLPNSSAIVYRASERSSQSELYWVGADGSGHRVLTPTLGIVIADAGEFRCSPSGEILGFVGNFSTYFARDVYALRLDEVEAQLLTNVVYTATSSTLRWAPEGSQDP